MNISANQAQLLRQLNIKPLQSRSLFSPECSAHSESSFQLEAITAEQATLLQPDDNLFSSDVRKQLAQTAINNWLIDPTANKCTLAENGSMLITPGMTSLQHPSAKQQLWALLQQQLADNAD